MTFSSFLVLRKRLRVAFSFFLWGVEHELEKASRGFEGVGLKGASRG